MSADDRDDSFAAQSPLHSVIAHLASHGTAGPSGRAANRPIVITANGAGSAAELGGMLAGDSSPEILTLEQARQSSCETIAEARWLALAGPFEAGRLVDAIELSAAAGPRFISLHNQIPDDHDPPLDPADRTDPGQADSDAGILARFPREHRNYELIHYSNARQPLLLFQRREPDLDDIRVSPSDRKYVLERQEFDRIVDIDELYGLYCSQKNMDIHVHLPMLRELASGLDHVTEFGTRHGISCAAFMAGRPARLAAFDLVRQPAIDLLERLAFDAGVDFRFHEENILKADIEPTDLLFIDSTHTYEHLKIELERFAHYCRRYLVFHDTYLFGETGMYRADASIDDGIDIPNPPEQRHARERIQTRGLLQAIAEFLDHNGDYRMIVHSQLNNGLVVLEKTS